jgi:hypothetical protein
LVWHGLHERLHQQDVDHGGFVNHQQITVERVVVAVLKASTFGVDLQQPVVVLASRPVASVIRLLGGPDRLGRGRRPSQHIVIERA